MNGNPMNQTDLSASPNRPESHKETKGLLGIKPIITIAVILILVIAFPIICHFTGGTIGKIVGTAAGSFRAVTEDIPNGYYQGKEDGLNADDTSISINKIRETGNLAVLAANAKLINLHAVGEKYKALYEIPTDVIFTVDLTQMKTYEDADGYGAMIVEVPEPAARIEIDPEKVKKLDDWQRYIFNGSTEDGMKAYTNMLKSITNNAAEELQDYDLLLVSAENSAEKQIKALIESIDGDTRNVKVLFSKKGSEKQ